jgi:Protein kinase domain/WD40-like Beta Propeller Repeat
MGEVYRARDTRLGREIAIKVSAERFGERFEREARVISSLNHPNICTLYDVGPNYLVMELVEGPTLAERIKEGPIPLAEGLGIARQIADGLEAAHEKGITHRDLKPGNIKIKPDGTVKVLDFGLAKVGPRTASGGGQDPENSPTISMAATQAGVILGTAAYMAPEQARGKPVDKRADIWAFGVVLYEMVTGKRLFQGEDLTETLASVVMKEPDLSDAPVELRRLLAKCLIKDPRKRLRDISGVELLLDDERAQSQAEAPPQDVILPPTGAKKWLWPSIAAVFAIMTAVVLVLWAPWRRRQPADRPLMRFSADLGPDAARSPRHTVAISPDGTRIAFAGRAGGVTRLYTRRLDQPDATLLVSGTSDFPELFFSPDGQWIGFEAGTNTIKKVAVQGGSAVPLGGTLGQIVGVSWGDDDNIVVGGYNGLWRLPGAGGMAKHLTEGVCLFPDVLPGSKAVLFDNDATSGLTLDSDSIEVLEFASGKRKTLIKEGYYPLYVPSSAEAGHLL